MNIIIGDTARGEFDNWPDMFVQFDSTTFMPDNTFEFNHYNESHILIDVNGVYLFQAIHNFLNQHNINSNQFTYITANFKCEQAYSNWRTMFNITDDPFNIIVYPGCSHNVNSEIVPAFDDTARPLKYVNLNNHSYMHRIQIINFLHNNDLIQYGSNSFHKRNSLLAEEILKQVPMEVDQLGPNSHEFDHDHLFVDSYFSIITESIFDRTPGNAMQALPPLDYEAWWVEGHVTEKTFRAFFHLHPFIIVGAAGSLEYLRSLGYQTFDGLIDESYDSIENPVDRMLAIQAEITKLCSYDIDTLRQWYISLKPILEHNQLAYINRA